MLSSFIGSYLIVYAIGYMLFIRPALTRRMKSTRWVDVLFYLSLIVLATIRFTQASS